MKRLALAGLVAVLTITAVALAAPKKGSWLTKLKSDDNYGEGSGVFRVASGPSIKTARQLRFILVPSDGSCGYPVIKKNKIPIKKGKFSYDAAGYLNADTPQEYKGQLTWKGTFTTRKKVRGTVRFQSPVTPRGPGKYQRKPCDTGTQKFVGKYSP